MGYLYILYSLKVDRYYIGSSTNPDRRILEHQRGQTRSTARGAPWEVKLLQSFPSKNEALHAEIRLKRWKNRFEIEKVIADGGFYFAG